MTRARRDNTRNTEESLSATDEALLPLVWAAMETGGLAETSGDDSTAELVPHDLREEFEETLECLRQLERVRQEIASPGEPDGVSPRTGGGTEVQELPPFGKDFTERPGASRRYVAGNIDPVPPVASAIPLSGNGIGLPLGKFQIVRELGRGGFAVVYLARDTRLRREVALKVPRPEALLSESLRERFTREARAAAALNHPGIVPVLEVGQHELECWIAYGYCDGPTLAQWLAARKEPVPARWVAEIMAELADAVQHAHSRGILHRDIKPSNVLLERAEGRGLRGEGNTEQVVASLDSQPSTLSLLVRLTDFGLAKVFDEHTSETRSGVVLGTADYMAPEQASGHVNDISVQTDVFALGAILYELLSGRPPFRGSSNIDTLRRVMHEEPPRLTELWCDAPRRNAGCQSSCESRRGASRHTGVPRDLETICLKCLEKDLQRRYSSAGALADDLRRYLAGEPIHARPAGQLERAVKWMRRRPAAATTFGLLTVLLVSLGAFGWWHVLQLRHYNSQLENAVTLQKQKTTEAQEQRQLADDRARLIKKQAYAHDLRLVQQFVENGQFRVAADLLNRYRPTPDTEDLRGF